MNKPTFYDLLNCTRHSTAAQIAAEFRLLSLAHHPDRATTVQASPSKDEEEYKQIVIAYTLLSDPAERAVYDKWLDSGISVPFEQWRSISTVAHGFALTHAYRLCIGQETTAMCNSSKMALKRKKRMMATNERQQDKSFASTVYRQHCVYLQQKKPVLLLCYGMARSLHQCAFDTQDRLKLGVRLDGQGGKNACPPRSKASLVVFNRQLGWLAVLNSRLDATGTDLLDLCTKGIVTGTMFGG